MSVLVNRAFYSEPLMSAPGRLHITAEKICVELIVKENGSRKFRSFTLDEFEELKCILTKQDFYKEGLEDVYASELTEVRKRAKHIQEFLFPDEKHNTNLFSHNQFLQSPNSSDVLEEMNVDSTVPTASDVLEEHADESDLLGCIINGLNQPLAMLINGLQNYACNRKPDTLSTVSDSIKKVVIKNDSRFCNLLDESGKIIYHSVGKILKFDEKFYKIDYAYSRLWIYLLKQDRDGTFSQKSKVVDASMYTPLFNALSPTGFSEEIDDIILDESEHSAIVRVGDKYYYPHGSVSISTSYKGLFK